MHSIPPVLLVPGGHRKPNMEECNVNAINTHSQLFVWKLYKLGAVSEDLLLVAKYKKFMTVLFGLD